MLRTSNTFLSRVLAMAECLLLLLVTAPALRMRTRPLLHTYRSHLIPVPPRRSAHHHTLLHRTMIAIVDLLHPRTRLRPLRSISPHPRIPLPARGTRRLRRRSAPLHLVTHRQVPHSAQRPQGTLRRVLPSVPPLLVVSCSHPHFLPNTHHAVHRFT